MNLKHPCSGHSPWLAHLTSMSSCGLLVCCLCRCAALRAAVDVIMHAHACCGGSPPEGRFSRLHDDIDSATARVAGMGMAGLGRGVHLVRWHLHSPWPP